jgi:serine/threonine-protein kinase
VSSAAPGEDEDALHALCLADRLWTERYEGWSELGRGGSACVVKAKSRALGQDVALKVFQRLHDDDWRRFQQEVLNAQQLSSPYVVRTFSPFPRGSVSWIELELVDGENLKQALERSARAGTPFPLGEAFAIAVAVARALVAAHQASMIHRDVKPANVLLPRSGQPPAKLGDFGISRLASAARVTHTGLLAGTPQFAAPELLAGEPAGFASDVYSLGLCLYLLFSGNRSPFDLSEDAAPAQWLRAHAEATPRPLRERRSDAPLGLERLLAQALAKQPPARPSAAQLLAGLESLERDPAASIARRPRPTPLLAGAALVLAAALLARRGLDSPQEPPPQRRPPIPRPTTLSSPPLALASTAPPAAAPEAAKASPPARSPAASATPAGAALHASLALNLLTIANGSGETFSELTIALLGGGRAFTATPSGSLRPDEVLLLALDEFQPPLPAGLRPEQVELIGFDSVGQRRRLTLPLR